MSWCNNILIINFKAVINNFAKTIYFFFAPQRIQGLVNCSDILNVFQILSKTIISKLCIKEIIFKIFSEKLCNLCISNYMFLIVLNILYTTKTKTCSYTEQYII